MKQCVDVNLNHTERDFVNVDKLRSEASEFEVVADRVERDGRGKEYQRPRGRRSIKRLCHDSNLRTAVTQHGDNATRAIPIIKKYADATVMSYDEYVVGLHFFMTLFINSSLSSRVLTDTFWSTLYFSLYARLLSLASRRY